VQAASLAVLDHDFPIVLLTTKLETRLGNTPNSATKDETKVDRRRDLQHKIILSALQCTINLWLPFKVFKMRLLRRGFHTLVKNASFSPQPMWDLTKTI